MRMGALGLLACAAALAGTSATPVLPLTPAEQKAAAGDGASGAARRPGIPLDHSEQPYGFMYLKGSPTKFEVFRANFGGLLPCGSRQLAWMPDQFGCATVREPVVSGRFAVAVRGNCTFATKAAYAQKAGAHGLIVINDQPGLLRMPLGNRSINEDNAIYLPSVMVRQSFAGVIETFSSSGHNLTAALRPFRADCIPDKVYVPHQRIRQKNAPSSPKLVAQGVKSPFDIPPPGETNWEPVVATGGILAVSDGRAGRSGREGHMSVGPDGHIKSISSGRAIRTEFALADFGGPPIGGTMRLMLADPIDACSPLVDPHGMLRGAAVIARRGTCPMINKARAAQAAQANVLVLINNDETDKLNAELFRLASELPGSAGASGSDLVDSTDEVAAALKAAIPEPERLGLVQAAPDDAPDDIHIATVMVPAESGDRIEKVLAANRGTAFLSIDASKDMPVGESWNELRRLARESGDFWPKDERAVTQEMVRMVRLCDPRSLTGSDERIQALIGLSIASGAAHGRQLLELLHEVNFHPDGKPMDHWSDSASVAPTPRLHSSEPASAFLLNRLPAHSVNLRNSDSLGCTVEGGLAHVRVPDVTPGQSVGITLTPRVVDLLKHQACLEKLLLRNTAALGNMIALMQRETEEAVYSAQVHALFRRFGSPSGEQSTNMADSYVSAAEAIMRAIKPNANATVATGAAKNDGTVGSMLRGE